ncbi:helix-turn-helix transcriptional regulator [Streptomyces sp. Tu 2975]|uniref:helix-turn-helix transcriptional regulator n=1 Tax=Streptomyces sp. Tu 2975 TaxID=2676871 RepID=UPI00135C3493|nr:helix-turn-helix transcriptional regulator [Streptomyces sp. Tu 2975]QIP83212.1 helix-turn-helix transcriptional regulator [Streptomyces sp. Tu 2975]
MLEALGLSTAESQVYRTLVGSGRCPVDRLEQGTGLAGAQLDQAVAALAAKGLVALTDDLPAQLIPAPPDIAGETLLLARMDELQSAKGFLKQLTKEYREAHRPAALEEIAEIVPAEVLSQRCEQVQLSARREVLRFDAPPFLLIDESNAAELEQLAAGVRFRTVYDRAAIEGYAAQLEIRRYMDAGEQARVLARLPVKLIIADRSTALLAVRTDDGRAPGAVVQIHQGPLLDALVALFELVWDTALPLEPSPGEVHRGELSGSDAHLLLLLLSGLTDDAIARLTGIGKRTVNRRVRALMHLAGASSRMQLGWQARERGWITAQDLDGLQPSGNG